MCDCVALNVGSTCHRVLMAEVRLTHGDPRMGTVWLGLRTDGMDAMLHDTGSAIELVVTYDRGHPYERQIVGHSVRWGDDPDYRNHDYTFPNQVFFRDRRGDLRLVGPYGRRHSFGAVQETRIRFRYALESGSSAADYSKLHALRSRIEGLEEWMPISCVDYQRLPDADGGATDVITLRRRDPVNFARSLNASLRPNYSFSVSPVPGESLINDEVIVETRSTKARTWDEHLDLHRSIRDLLVVAGWRGYGIRELTAQRTDDPVRALAGNVLSPRWSKVDTHQVAAPAIDTSRSAFLFDYDDVAAKGLRRWTRLRTNHRRAITGMIHSIDLRGMALETTVSEAGAALEHLGYGLTLKERERPGRRLRDHLSRITREIRADIGFDLDEWVGRFANVYNTVKHPDRADDFTAVEIADALRQARIVFRCWVASSLGMSQSAMEQNLRFVPMSRALEP